MAAEDDRPDIPPGLFASSGLSPVERVDPQSVTSSPTLREHRDSDLAAAVTAAVTITADDADDEPATLARNHDRSRAVGAAPHVATPLPANGPEPASERRDCPATLTSPHRRFTAPQIGREQTGETGLFVERQRLAAPFELNIDIEDLPDIESPAQESGWQYVTGHHPRSLRKFLLTRLIPVGGLLAVITWSAMSLREPTRPPIRPPPNEATSAAALTTAIDAADPPARPPELPDEDEDEVEVTKALGLMASYAQDVTRDGAVNNIQLRNAISPRKVTVLSLWATWCGACLNELPFFQEMFKHQGAAWNAEVKFVPLMVLDPADGRMAFRDRSDVMPPFDHFLVDRDLSIGPKAALIAAKYIPAKLDLPVTLLIDCRRKVHKVYTKAFTTMEEFQAFGAEIQKLRDQLDTPRCRRAPPQAPTPEPTPPRAMDISLLKGDDFGPVPPPPPTQAKASRPPPPRRTRGCGDNFCDRKLGETCLCPSDCPCSSNESCIHRPGELPACLPRKISLGP